MSTNKPTTCLPMPLAVSQAWLAKFHRDQRGSMSIVSVFALLFLAMLLGMVMNVGRHVDGKLRMQNAADSAAYSGGVVLSRGMNTLAFTNHLLCDVFAVTAFFREANNENSASYAPQILGAWNKVAGQFASSGFPKFTALGAAIRQKVPLEQKMVDSYSLWAKSVSDQVLPLMEEILSEELIPKYQRAVVAAFPDIAASAARETASRNGTPDFGRGTMYGVLWRTDGRPLGGGNEASYSPDDRTLPVVDPELDALANQSAYVQEAQNERYTLAHKYLDDWNNEALVAFDQEGQMSQFSNLWRSFTCGYLNQLLNDEYPTSNLPMMIHDDPNSQSNPTTELQQHYTFIAVVYWKKLPEMAPGLFHNPLEPDAQAFAEVHLFLPRDRLAWVQENVSSSGPSVTLQGAVPGQIAYIGASQGGGAGGGSGSSGAEEWTVGRVGGPGPSDWPLRKAWGLDKLPLWSLLNQSWDCQLAPVTQPALATILQTDPQLADFDSENYVLPNLGGLTGDDLQQISPH